MPLRCALTLGALLSLLAGSCADDADEAQEEQLLEVVTGEWISLIDEGATATVEVFFGFPVVTIADYVPSDVQCTFSGGFVETESRPFEITVTPRAGREVTPLATYVVRALSDTSMSCEDHAQREIELAVLVST